MPAALYCGDTLAVLASLPAQSVQCVVTSPPYWNLRDYQMPGQLGLEGTPEAYTAALVGVFREVRRVLRDDGTLWLNLGDSYARAGGWSDNSGLDGLARGESGRARTNAPEGTASQRLAYGLKSKDLVGIPWRVAFALQADGWYLRSDIIWHKPNPMPESVTDRPTKSHEYLFLLTKNERYYYNAEAIAEEATCADPRMVDGFVPKSDNGKHKGAPQSAAVRKQDGTGNRTYTGFNDRYQPRATRNARTVWTIPTAPYTGAHFATFPAEIPRRCILAGSRPGDTILDPFGGSGTTSAIAEGLGRPSAYIELNPAYLELARQRIGPMLCEVVP